MTPPVTPPVTPPATAPVTPPLTASTPPSLATSATTFATTKLRLKRSTGHVVYMVLLGLAGWAGVIFAPQLVELSGTAPRSAPVQSLALFFAVVLGARLMAVRVLPEVRLSLDSAFYIAATLALGTVPAAQLAALTLTLDAVIRLLRSPRGQRGLAARLVFIGYYGGMTGGLLVGASLLAGAEQFLPQATEVETLGRVALVGGLFLVAHYALQGIRLALQGITPREVVLRLALPGLLGEAAMLPLAVVVVQMHRPGDPLGLVLLGGTYLLLNLAYHRLSKTSTALGRRVAELETLNRTAHALGTRLELPELVAALARETLAALPDATAFALARREGNELNIEIHAGGRFRRARADASEGAPGRVLSERKRVTLDGIVPGSAPSFPDSGARAWLGVPLEAHGEVVGLLAVSSRDGDGFDEDETRLLEAIGAQAAVAVENARLYELATVDGLTGLYVRRYFDTRLREELERARRFGTAFSLLLLDIDDFKRMNDTLGHAAGDRVLREVAQSTRAGLRAIDIPARYGGEEFAYILPRTQLLEAHGVAERIRQDVAATRVEASGRTLSVTVSIGVACYPESGEGDAAALVERADMALYRAKAAGKDRVEMLWGNETGRHERIDPP